MPKKTMKTQKPIDLRTFGLVILGELSLQSSIDDVGEAVVVGSSSGGVELSYGGIDLVGECVGTDGLRGGKERERKARKSIEA